MEVKVDAKQALAGGRQGASADWTNIANERGLVYL